MAFTAEIIERKARNQLTLFTSHATIAKGTYSKKDWETRKDEFRKEFLRAHWENCCQGCGKDFTEILKPTLDHIRLERDGGKDIISNLILLCAKCDNELKSHLKTISGLREMAGFAKDPRCKDLWF